FIDAADSDQKRMRAGAAGEPGRFGIEKSPARGMRLRDQTLGNGCQQVLRQIEQVPESYGAMPPVALVETLGFEVRAKRCFDNFAGKNVFDETGLNPRFPGRVLAIDLCDFFP